MIEFYLSCRDIAVEIQLLEAQIELTDTERKMWYKQGCIGNEYKLLTTLEKMDRLDRKTLWLHEQLEFKKNEIDTIKKIAENFTSLEHDIAVRKYIYGKTLKVIAEELGYSYEHIRRTHSLWKKRCYKDATHSIEIV